MAKSGAFDLEARVRMHMRAPGNLGPQHGPTVHAGQWHSRSVAQCSGEAGIRGVEGKTNAMPLGLGRSRA
jgi:hypothetical protein